MSTIINYTAGQLEGMKDTLNVGLQSAAETMQKLLNQEVTISTDKVEMEEIDNLEIFGLIPAIAAKVEYSGALSGKCVIIIRQADVKHILNILMNIDDSADDPETDADELDLDEITFSTVRELCNQMTTAYGATLTDFFGDEITVTTMDIEGFENMTSIESYFGCDAETNVVNSVCRLGIKDIMSSCFCIVLENPLTEALSKHIVTPSQTEKAAEAVAPTAGGKSKKAADGQQEAVTHAEAPGIRNAMGAPEEEDDIDEITRVGRMQTAQFPTFMEQKDARGVPLTHGNMDLLMDVPLNVTVEIGKTRRKMKDIMDFAQGTIISLEKQAGAPVDIVVNGQLIARGDVVVIDDNFGVRITEIVGSKEFGEKD